MLGGSSNLPFGKSSQGAVKEPWVVPQGTGTAHEAPALISRDCTLVGRLLLKKTESAGRGASQSRPSSAEGSAQIEGVVEGEIIAEGDLLIGESARVTASITGVCVRVLGTVTGDISCSERLEILNGAQVRGNIEAPTIVINDGAMFEGRCSMRAAVEAGKAQFSSTDFAANS